MKNIISVLAVSSLLCVSMLYGQDVALGNLEISAKTSATDYKDLSQKINISGVSQSIVAHDAVALKDALQDVIRLNRTITSQIESAMGFWNLYLDSVQAPTHEGYLLGQVMSSFLGSLRSLFLRSSVDQAMLLSLIKKNFDTDNQPNVQQAVEVQGTTIEDRWSALKAE